MPAPKYIPKRENYAAWEYVPETGLILDENKDEVPFTISKKNGEKLVYIVEDSRCIAYTRLCLLIHGVDMTALVIVRKDGDNTNNALDNLLLFTPGDRNHYYHLVKKAQRRLGLSIPASQIPLGDPTQAKRENYYAP